MTTYVYRNGELVEKHLASPRGKQYVSGVISDNIPDLVHPANGKRYDSKSAFRKVTKAHGYQEVGTEKQKDTRKLGHQDFKRDVGEAIQKLREGYRPNDGPWAKGDYSGGDGWQ